MNTVFLDSCTWSFLWIKIMIERKICVANFSRGTHKIFEPIKKRATHNRVQSMRKTQTVHVSLKENHPPPPRHRSFDLWASPLKGGFLQLFFFFHFQEQHLRNRADAGQGGWRSMKRPWVEEDIRFPFARKALFLVFMRWISDSELFWSWSQNGAQRVHAQVLCVVVFALDTHTPVLWYKENIFFRDKDATCLHCFGLSAWKFTAPFNAHQVRWLT